MGILGLMEINDETSNTNKYNMVKNPNWQEENQLSIHKSDLGVEGLPRNNSSLVA